MYREDNRTVVTLDAGGTNFVFGAIRANKFIVDPITMPSNADDLDRCLATMVEGFERVIAQLDAKPAAISFAFPGPADYPNGIIGGYLIAVATNIMIPSNYIDGILIDFKRYSIVYSLIKSAVFAYIITSVSAFFGYYAKGNSLEVGAASTRAVVVGSVVIMIFNLMLTQILLI